MTQKEIIIDEICGIRVSDPFRWLEGAEKPEVKDWIKEQNKQVDLELKDGNFNTFSNELVRNFKTTTFSNLVPIKGQYFYIERQPDEDQSVLYVKKGLNGNPVILFNPNGKKTGNTVTIDYWTPSRSGKYVAYGISEGGDEMSTIYIKNVHTLTDMPEKILNCRYASICWLADDSGFYYTRNPRPGTIDNKDESMYMKVYFHKIGTDSDIDELIFGENRPKDDMINMTLSLDDKYLAIHVSNEWTKNDIYLYDTITKKITPLITGFSAHFSLHFLNNKVVIYTNYKANNFKILWNTYEEMSKPIDQWEVLIPEKEHILESIRFTKSKILVEYLVNVCSEAVIFDYNGKEIEKIPLPKYSSLDGVSSRREEDEFFYSVNSFLFPRIIYRFDPVTSEYYKYRKTENPINPEGYQVKQEWYPSKDGTIIPMFIYHRKGLILNSSNPTILYGYGGFNHSGTPSFMRSWVPWAERGGVFAVANIRGGGEFGDKWHKAGIYKNKQNSFDDFISAAEYLIKSKYTNKEKLGILGASNGGLLVSAVAVQKPDIFKAVCSRVPLTDMVRFSKFGMAMRLAHEYGNPDIKEDLERILAWSPYHNVKEGVRYPDFFFTTANKDTRVDPLHARKMAAMLQTSNKENNVLIFTETDAGHGSGKPVVKIVESQSLLLSFFAKKLGLKI
jgi:prolyl oligopeptidase